MERWEGERTAVEEDIKEKRDGTRKGVLARRGRQRKVGRRKQDMVSVLPPNATHFTHVLRSPSFNFSPPPPPPLCSLYFLTSSPTLLPSIITFSA